MPDKRILGHLCDSPCEAFLWEDDCCMEEGHRFIRAMDVQSPGGEAQGSRARRLGPPAPRGSAACGRGARKRKRGREEEEEQIAEEKKKSEEVEKRFTKQESKTEGEGSKEGRRPLQGDRDGSHFGCEEKVPEEVEKENKEERPEEELLIAEPDVQREPQRKRERGSFQSNARDEVVQRRHGHPGALTASWITSCQDHLLQTRGGWTPCKMARCQSWRGSTSGWFYTKK